MRVQIGINGFGRIGRLTLRAAMARGDVEVVAVNSRGDARSLAYLLKYDSVHGHYGGIVDHTDEALIVDGKEIPVLALEDPVDVRWDRFGVDVVVECTGQRTDRRSASRHLEGGAPRVIISAPAKGRDGVPVVVVGVNDDTLTATSLVVSNASCTTQCLAPMAKVLHDTFGIESGLMTSIHAYTRDQSLVDKSHMDLRRGRAAAMSLVPTTTGAARAIGKVIPELQGRLDGLAVRAPVVDGSLVDLVVQTRERAGIRDVNEAFERASRGPLRGILEYQRIPLYRRTSSATLTRVYTTRSRPWQEPAT